MRLQLCCENLAGLLHSLHTERLKCVSLCSAAMTLKWRIMGTSGVWVQCWGIWSRRGRTPHVSESYIVPFSPLHVVLHSDAHAELPSSTVALCSCMSEQKCHSKKYWQLLTFMTNLRHRALQLVYTLTQWLSVSIDFSTSISLISETAPH